MNPWTCASLIAIAGALGGVVNALLTDNGFILPSRMRNIWCPGFLSNVLVGAFSAFASWAFDGSGASVELTRLNEAGADQPEIFGVLAGTFLVGVAGARWITNEVDKKLRKETVKEAVNRDRSPSASAIKSSTRRPERRSERWSGPGRESWPPVWLASNGTGNIRPGNPRPRS